MITDECYVWRDMYSSNVIKVIKDYANSKSQSIDQLIAKTILENINNFEQINLTQLAKKSFTSTASVIRFCKKLGYTGYSEFKVLLLQSCEEEFQKKMKSCMIDNYFSCNKFWIEMRHYNFLVGKEKVTQLKEYFRHEKKVYLTIDGCPYTSMMTFTNRLNEMFNEFEFEVANSENFDEIKTDRFLVLLFSKNNPRWFKQNGIHYLQFFTPLFTCRDISWSDKFDYIIILLVKLFACI